MNKVIVSLAAASGLVLAAGASEAKGVVKGAVVGATAGHFVGKGHAKSGAVVGAVAGHHMAKKKAAQAK